MNINDVPCRPTKGRKITWHNLSAKCPVILGLLLTDYAKLYLYDP